MHCVTKFSDLVITELHILIVFFLCYYYSYKGQDLSDRPLGHKSVNSSHGQNSPSFRGKLKKKGINK